MIFNYKIFLILGNTNKIKSLIRVLILCGLEFKKHDILSDFFIKKGF